MNIIEKDSQVILEGISEDFERNMFLIVANVSDGLEKKMVHIRVVQEEL